MSKTPTPFERASGRPAPHTRLVRCTAFNNGGHGFSVPAGTEMDDCHAYNNGGDGIHVRSVPAELRQAIVNEVAGGADGRTIHQKFGERLKGFGVLTEGLVSVAANSASLFQFLAGLAANS